MSFDRPGPAGIAALIVVLTPLLLLSGCSPRDSAPQDSAPRDSAPQGGDPQAATPEPVSGRELYQRHGCALCHGPEGRGDGPVSATLYPPARDLRDPTSYRIGPSEEVIATTLEQGILVFGGSGMTPFAHIPAADRLELARYIVSLQEPVHEAEPVQEPVAKP